MRPRVYVILVNYNGWRDTIECLETLFASDYENFRVIVADNASSDGSLAHIAEWARGSVPVSRPFFAGMTGDLGTSRSSFETITCRPSDIPDVDVPLTLLDVGTNGGFAAGNNAAMRHVMARSDARYICLLNNDTVVARNSLSALVAAAERDERVGAVGATLVEYFAPDTVQCAPGGTVRRWNGHARATGAAEPLQQLTKREDFNFICGACLLVRTDMLEGVGLLDERFFMYNEDADWCLRIEAAGYKLSHARDAIVWHKGGRSSIPASPTHDFHIVRSSLLFVHKLDPVRLPAAFAYSIARCVLPKVARGQWTRFRAVWRAYSDVWAYVTASREPRELVRSSSP